MCQRTVCGEVPRDLAVTWSLSTRTAQIALRSPRYLRSVGPLPHGYSIHLSRLAQAYKGRDRRRSRPGRTLARGDQPFGGHYGLIRLLIVLRRSASAVLVPTLSRSPVFGIVSVEKGGGNAAHRLHLLGGQIFSPAARASFTVKSSHTLLSFGDVLSSMLLYHPGQLSLVCRDLQGAVDATHGCERICSQVLVPDQNLAPFVGVVGLLGKL